MRALQFKRFGTLDELSYLDLPTPEIGADEVRVEIRAAGINPSDVKNVFGRLPYTTLPRTPGRDFAGVVVEGPDDLVGAEVWGTGSELGFTRDGTHAEHVVLPRAAIARKPRSLTFEEAAAVGVPYTTAWEALERMRVDARTSFLVIGAGAVGRAAIGLARARGAEPLVAVRRREQVEALRGEGARAVLLEDADALQASVRRVFPDGADAIFDTTGFRVPSAVDCIAKFGRIAIIAAPPDGHVNVPVLKLYRMGGTLVGINSLLHDGRACARMLDAIGDAFDAGSLAKPAAPVAYPLDAGLSAYRAVDRGCPDKIVLVSA